MADEIIKLYEYFAGNPMFQAIGVAAIAYVVLFLIFFFGVVFLIIHQWRKMNKEFKDFDKHFKNW